MPALDWRKLEAAVQADAGINHAVAGAGPAKKIETTREKPQFAGFIDQFKMQIVTELSAIGALSASKTVECERYNARLVNGYARIWLLVSGFSIAFTPRP